MRAVLELARGGLKRRQYRKIANAMRLAAKPLSAPRDALVTKNALGKLSPRSAKLFETVRRSLEVYSNLEEHFYQANEIGAVTRYILQKLSKSTAELKTTQSGWRDLHPCLRKSYVRGRRA